MRRTGGTGFDRRMGGAMFITSCLTVLGVLDAVLTPGAALFLLASRAADGHLDAALAGQLLGVLILGWTLAGLLLGLSALLRYAHTVSRSSDRIAGGGDSGEASVPEGSEPGSAQPWPGADHVAWNTTPRRRDDREVVGLLRAIRDMILLSPPGDPGPDDAGRTGHQRRIAAEIIDAINQRELGRARALLSDARAVFGEAPTLDNLVPRLEQAARRNEPLDYARTKRLVDEAALEGRWGQAEAAVRTLYFDHPDVPRCRTLWEDFRRARLYAYIQTVSDRRLWAEARAAAEEFLLRFPDGPESRAIRDQMDTFRHNAEVEQRKRFEQRVHDLVHDGHFGEALRVARYLVDQYPESPQARALKPRIAELEKRTAAPPRRPSPS